MREGKFQRQVAIVTGVSALLSGFEAYYSHYKNNFRYWVQWTPVVLAPVLAGYGVRVSEEPSNRDYGAAGALRRCGSRCRCRLLLSRTRRAAPTWWSETRRLQHHVRPTHLCAPAVRRGGNAGRAGQPAPSEATMKSNLPPADAALRPRDPAT